MANQQAVVLSERAVRSENIVRWALRTEERRLSRAQVTSAGTSYMHGNGFGKTTDWVLAADSNHNQTFDDVLDGTWHHLSYTRAMARYRPPNRHRHNATPPEDAEVFLSSLRRSEPTGYNL